ncbi:unnamed protein product [Closterium sp. NIES-65]|nr:unnamed protein product [Closterium sp. NIES-65]
MVSHPQYHAFPSRRPPFPSPSLPVAFPSRRPPFPSPSLPVARASSRRTRNPFLPLSPSPSLSPSPCHPLLVALAFHPASLPISHTLLTALSPSPLKPTAQLLSEFPHSSDAPYPRTPASRSLSPCTHRTRIVPLSSSTAPAAAPSASPCFPPASPSLPPDYHISKLLLPVISPFASPRLPSFPSFTSLLTSFPPLLSSFSLCFPSSPPLLPLISLPPSPHFPP